MTSYGVLTQHTEFKRLAADKQVASSLHGPERTWVFALYSVSYIGIVYLMETQNTYRFYLFTRKSFLIIIFIYRNVGNLYLLKTLRCGKSYSILYVTLLQGYHYFRNTDCNIILLNMSQINDL